MTLAWLSLAAALALLGGPPRASRGSSPSPRTLQLFAAAASAVALGLTFGPLAGAVGGAVAAVVVGRLARRAPRVRAGPDLAVTLDLIAVALRTGQPVDAALRLAAPACPQVSDALLRVAGLLRLGADPHDAWAVLADDPVLVPVATVARRSATSGIRLASAFTQLAADVRAEQRALHLARAERAGVLAAAPLGLCFLPAFVCLGVAPIVIGVARGVLTS